MYDGDTWVEGLGSLAFPLMPFDYVFEWGWEVMCYENSGEVLYGHVAYTPTGPFWICDQTASVYETLGDHRAITVSPNPGQGAFTVKSEGMHMQKIDIYDILGKKVYSSRIEHGEIKVSLDVPAGVYMVKVSGTGGEVTTRKIIVQ
jgi:hypothetical protein